MSEISQEKSAHQARYTADNSIGPYRQTIYNKNLGVDGGMAKIYFQPYYPTMELMKPSDILDKIVEIRNGDGRFSPTFPSINKDPITNGVADFEWRRRTGNIRCEQIISNGLVFFAWELMERDPQTGTGCIRLSHLSTFIFHVLRGVMNYYRLSQFSGVVVGYIQIDNVEGVEVKQAMTSSVFGFDDDITALQNKYYFDIELDTNTLYDMHKFQDYFIELIKKIFWSFGYKISDGFVKSYLKMQGWLVEETS